MSDTGAPRADTSTDTVAPRLKRLSRGAMVKSGTIRLLGKDENRHPLRRSMVCGITGHWVRRRTVESNPAVVFPWERQPPVSSSRHYHHHNGGTVERADASSGLAWFPLSYLRINWAAASLARQMQLERIVCQPGGTNARFIHVPMRLLPIIHRVRTKMGTGLDLRPRAQWPGSQLPPLPL